MNRQREFVHDTFHLLAQPITALRANVELGLSQEANQPAVQQIFQDCLSLLDRLMQDLAVFREIASLDEEPVLGPCDGRALLESSVEEMAPVAEAYGVALHLSAEAAELQCRGPMLQRAVFVLLDAMIACAPKGGSISIRLDKAEDGFRLALYPGAPPGRRQELCRKLMRFAGCRCIQFDAACTSVTFRKSDHRQASEDTSADKQLLTLHSSFPKSGTVQIIL
jgi:signal transduction histidine kinase